METPEESETRGHFDADWMKEGRDGKGREEGEQNRGRGRQQNPKGNKTSPSWDTSQDGPFI